MAEEIILRVENIRAGYTDLDILKNAGAEVKKDQIVSIIGPNGAGKSTLLKAIFGLLKPRDGKVTLKDKNITGKEPHEIVKYGISYVPQLENVFPSLSVEENLEMGGVILEDPTEGMERVYRLFPTLKKRKKDLVGTLSGGQQKMVAFGRGLMLNPEVLLLDEPSAGLAPKIAETVYNRIVRINESGTAILMVEQNAREALKMSDYAYVLEEGQNRFKGEGESLLNNEEVERLYLGG